jgi:hypothetical protein
MSDATGRRLYQHLAPVPARLPNLCYVARLRRQWIEGFHGAGVVAIHRPAPAAKSETTPCGRSSTSENPGQQPCIRAPTPQRKVRPQPRLCRRVREGGGELRSRLLGAGSLERESVVTSSVGKKPRGLAGLHLSRICSVLAGRPSMRRWTSPSPRISSVTLSSPAPL